MKLIRTLIDNKRAEDGTLLRPSEIAEKPRSRSDAPVSEALENAQREPAPVEPPKDTAKYIEPREEIDPRMEEFKSDLEELTPRRTPVTTGPKRKKVWDLDAEMLATPHEEVQTLPIEIPEDLLDAKSQEPKPETSPRHRRMSRPFEVPNPLAPRNTMSGGRVKTRIMGFGSGDTSGDIFDLADSEDDGSLDFPVGWLVVTKGPGRGKHFTLQSVVATIGRGEGQTITLNFGDDTISRNNHAALAYDDQMNVCFLGYGGKANLVRLNGRPVLATEQLTHGDIIRVGETDLRFVALCGPDFTWDEGTATGDG